MNARLPNDLAQLRSRTSRWHRGRVMLCAAIVATCTLVSAPVAAGAVEAVPDAGTTATDGSTAPLLAPDPSGTTPLTTTPDPAAPGTTPPDSTPPGTTTPPDQPGTPTPDPPVTPEPTVEPTPEPTPTTIPTTSPTPTPSTTPTTEPTTSPTPTPTTIPTTTPTTAPPSSTPTTAPVRVTTPPRLVTSPRFGVGSAFGTAALAATQRSAALTRATLLVSKTANALSTAQSRYNLVKQQYDSAIVAVAVLEDRATVLEEQASASTLLLVQAMRQNGTANSDLTPLDVFFGGGSGRQDQVLNELSGVDRLNKLSADVDAITARAEKEHNRAVTAREQAVVARDAAEQLPLAEARDELAVAKRAAASATSALEKLRLANASVASTEISLIPPMPSDDGRLSTSLWSLPGVGPVTDGYGPRPSQPGGANPFHFAVDIGTGCNAWIYAAASGTVLAASPFSGLGNRVVIDHGDGITTTYAHIVDGGTAVSVGQQVQSGEAIALSGSTGISTGCHLHFEVSIDGVRTDPVPFMVARGVQIG